MKYLSICLSICFLTACAPQVDSTQPYTDAQLYQGYPCLDECDDFKKGYDFALTNKITNPVDCTGDSLAIVTGCKAYTSDYAFDNQTFDELVTGM